MGEIEGGAKSKRTTVTGVSFTNVSFDGKCVASAEGFRDVSGLTLACP